MKDSDQVLRRSEADLAELTFGTSSRNLENRLKTLFKQNDKKWEGPMERHDKAAQNILIVNLCMEQTYRNKKGICKFFSTKKELKASLKNKTKLQ